MTTSKSTALSTAVFTQEECGKAAAAVLRGDLVLSIKANPRVERLSDVNIAGYLLLKHCLDDLRPKDVCFAGNMYEFKYASPSTKQLKYLKDLLSQHLGVDIEEVASYAE